MIGEVVAMISKHELHENKSPLATYPCTHTHVHTLTAVQVGSHELAKQHQVRL